MEPLVLRGEPAKLASLFGSGYGDGYGDGSGDGDGSGSGDGYGDGDGSGSGSGDGYGDGYGDGSKEYWLGTVPYFAKKLPEQQQKRLAELQTAGATIALGAYFQTTSPR